MNRTIVCLLILAVSACGIQRPLVKPSAIPAYEEKQRQKLERHQIDPVPIPPTPEIVQP